MLHVLFGPEGKYNTAILIKRNALRDYDMRQHYVVPLHKLGVEPQELIAFDLPYDGKKPTVKYQKEYLTTELLPVLDQCKIGTLYVADSEYFKTLAGQKKAEVHLGAAFPCAIPGYEHMTVVLGINYTRLIYDDRVKEQLAMSLGALAQARKGTLKELGADIIHSAQYPDSVREIAAFLDSLHQYPELSADFEAFSLQFWKSGIGTAGFAWDQHNGGAFCVDYQLVLGNAEQVINDDVRALLKNFLETYKGKLIWHNANYDCKIAIAQLWMEDWLDMRGLLRGLEILTRNFDDTKLIVYLATNSCAGNDLSLKFNAHEFAGNYAQSEIKDIRKIPKPDLLRYNLTDCLSTWFVRNKFYPIMVQDQQEALYLNLFKPSVKVLLQAELVGMPLNMPRVLEVEKELCAIRQGFIDVLVKSPIVQRYHTLLRKTKWQKDWDDRRNKAVNPHKIQPKDLSAFDKVTFNPNSNPQVQQMLYDMLNLPVIDLTDGKQPATGAGTLNKLRGTSTDPELHAVLDALIGFFEVDKIIGTFIKAFKENSILKADGWHYLHGNFNLGGTVSGRLSSSGPNMQNLPSTGSRYAKLIKSCFSAPPGALFCGADFNSLEDRISALTTRDKNKLKVYTDGFDGHSLRAVGYWPDAFPDIDPDDPKQVNVLKKQDHPLRQKSKTPTFALTYGGTFMAIMEQTGMPEAEAKMIEFRYHELYKESDEWVAKKIEQATHDGYVTVAFGLRVRTPLLGKVVYNDRMPFQAQAEGRTAGNALGQSWGMLNNRAAIEFQEQCLASPYATQILPVAHIHDAQYFLIKADPDVVAWANQHLTKAMAWQDDPLIYHPDVPLGGDLDIFWPDWAHPVSLDNSDGPEEVKQKCAAHKQALIEEGVI